MASKEMTDYWICVSKYNDDTCGTCQHRSPHIHSYECDPLCPSRLEGAKGCEQMTMAKYAVWRLTK